MLPRVMKKKEELEEPPLWFSKWTRLVADLWFDPKSFESEEIYERVGIKLFKKYLPTGDLASKVIWELNCQSNFIAGSSEEDLKNHEKFTRIYEGAHLILFLVMTAAIGEKLSDGYLNYSLFGIGINTIVNAYPILLQRYNRLRLYKAIKKAQMREAKKNQNI